MTLKDIRRDAPTGDQNQLAGFSRQGNLVAMGKLVLSILVAGFMVSSGFSQTYTDGEWNYTLNENSEATITSYNGPGGAVTIPSNINGNPVKQVGSGHAPVFVLGSANVASVSMPDSVTSVAPSAFEDCRDLTSVVFGTGLASIQDSAFRGCVSLRSFEIPDGVIMIGAGAFEGCTNLELVVLGSGLQEVGGMAFAHCASLKTLIFLGDAPATTGEPFVGNPSGYPVILYLDQASGWDSSWGSSDNLPDSDWRRSTKSAKQRNGHYYTTVDGPKWEQAQSQARQLAGNLVTIEDAAENTFLVESFAGKSGEVQGLWIGLNDVASENQWAWASGVDASYRNWFRSEPNGGTNENYVHMWTPNPWGYPIGRWNDIDSPPGRGLVDPSGQIKQFKGIVEIIPNALPEQPDSDRDEWTYRLNGSYEATITGYSGAGGAVVIPSSVGGYPVKAVGDGRPPVFGYGNSSVTSVTIPDGVKRIGEFAFYQCSSLTSVTIGDDVVSIGDAAFNDCPSLTSVSIPPGVTNIGAALFWGCVNLESVVLPAGMRSIPSRLFMDNRALRSITFMPNAAIAGTVVIPEGVTSIEDLAFWGCRSITNYSIPNTVSRIGGGAFADNTSLVDITIPETVTNIGESLFWGCVNLESVVLPAGMRSIPSRFFMDNRALRSITFMPDAAIVGTVVIPEGVTSIEDHAFWGCRSITNIIIPKSIASVGSVAFAVCDTLESILFLGNVPESVGVDVFGGGSDPTVHYVHTTSGWESLFSGRPTTAFNTDLSLAYALTIISASPQAFGLYGNDQYLQNRIDGQKDVTNNPSAFDLFTAAQHSDSRLAGRSDVLSSPASYNLYTSDSIMDLRMNGAMVRKEGETATVVFQPQTTMDLATQPFTNNGTPITNVIPMPGNKGFLRIQIKPPPLPVPTPPVVW